MAAKGKKGTRWKSAPGVFTQLTAHCQNDHNHLRYQVQSQNGTWTFDISTEAAYPQLLAARFAAAVKKFCYAKIFPFFLPPIPRGKTLAAQHRQHQKRNQLIPEFAETRWLSPTISLTDSKKGSLHLKSDPFIFKGMPRREGAHKKGQKEMVGTWHTLTGEARICVSNFSYLLGPKNRTGRSKSHPNDHLLDS